MSLFGGVIAIKDIPTLLVVVFAVLFLGYALGRITIKGISLGDAGVFIIALLFGALFFSMTDVGLVFSGSTKPFDFEEALSLIESLGLILFVTSVGFIAGPKFFGNFKKNFKSYVLIGAIVILAGGLAAAGCIGLGEVLGYGASITEQDGFVAMIVGLLSGSLTSTPAFAAAKATVAPEYVGLVSVGHGIAYIFGVVGVVLFVQLIPKLTKADMEKERNLLVVKADETKKSIVTKLFELDHMGIAPFALAAIVGTFIGQIKIPLSADGLSGTCFSLTTTGGCLLTSLVFGHFSRIGKVSIMPATGTLKLFRELGLVLFLVGAGIPGGAEFVQNFDPMYFVYGIIMTIVPLIIGYLFAKYVLKLSLLNNLGSLTGGMTSTPALGTLINVAKTEDVASAYAATYPIALVAVVLVSQFLIILF
ncbi:MAG: permease [Clostridia bacterium]|jgi:putative transport protein|nr:permease [Clostridia bacterium]MBQ5792319.1 permease [Clostridia bacterium]